MQGTRTNSLYYLNAKIVTVCRRKCQIMAPKAAARTETIWERKCFLSIVDDHSRKVWIYILKDTTQTLSKFEE